MEIHYLAHSGFMIKEGKMILVFDDYSDVKKVVVRALEKREFEQFYIFVSHAHFDHFDTHIRAYAKEVTRYIFSNDVKRTKRVKNFPAEDITFMRKYSYWEGEGIKVWTYSSTDVGVSFLVETQSGKRIFHAGDFNWWHWEEDTVTKQEMAKKEFERQLKRMKGLDVDVAFFPVDGRMGQAQEKGVTEFVKKTEIKSLVAMHREGYPAWIPSHKFLDQSRDLPIWSPVEPGEKRLLIDGKFVEK